MTGPPSCRLPEADATSRPKHGSGGPLLHGIKWQVSSATTTSRQLDQRYDERDAKHASVPLRRVRTGELRWETFLYELKAGPAGGRLRRPSSAGNRSPPGNLGRRGLQHRLDPRQPLAPHLLTLTVDDRVEHLERADRVGIASECHPRSPVRLLEGEAGLRPDRPDLRLELDLLVGLDSRKPRHRLPDPPERLLTEPERRPRPGGPVRRLRHRPGARVHLRRILVEGKEEAKDLLHRPRDRHRGLHPGHGMPLQLAGSHPRGCTAAWHALHRPTLNDPSCAWSLVLPRLQMEACQRGKWAPR